jgi:hypothetical protein
LFLWFFVVDCGLNVFVFFFVLAVVSATFYTVSPNSPRGLGLLLVFCGFTPASPRTPATTTSPALVSVVVVVVDGVVVFVGAIVVVAAVSAVVRVVMALDRQQLRKQL